MKIDELGYDNFFESNRLKLGLDYSQIARVIAEFKGAYKVKNTEGEYLAKITGKHIFEASCREDYPAVGDWVAITQLDEDNAIIDEIFPRKTVLKRKYCDKNDYQIIATNIDEAFIVESVGRDYNLNRFERYLTLSIDGGIKPVIILNKIDLISSSELNEKLSEIKNRFKDVDVISTSAITNEGLAELRKHIEKGKTYCFLGSSGVGKSSLINNLIGETRIKTGDIGKHTSRGKHVTTSREMYIIENGGVVIDNPGMRQIGITDANTGIACVFDEISELAQKCKFKDCTHTNEPGCEVLNALKTGRLPEEKYSNYIKLKKETEYYEMTKLEKREKNRKTGKFIKNAKKDFKKFKHKDYGD
ncbi:MAG: ribosome small subunit-dependent GTPase A [Parachlamydiales bacterium]|nr:ribosome small subunit-dependent GTPase A [Parachlamydiales bacterium]